MPRLMHWLLVLVLWGVLSYYGAILGGWFKDPMMAQFRRYGPPEPYYPLTRFLLVLGMVCVIGAPAIPNSWLGAVFFVLGLFIVISSLAAYRLRGVREVLPLWYFRLQKDTSREERRAIAYAWLRLPLRTRLRLNGDHYAFQTFIDEVRLTVIYGARDPDDPWEMWQ